MVLMITSLNRLLGELVEMYPTARMEVKHRLCVNEEGEALASFYIRVTSPGGYYEYDMVPLNGMVVSDHAYHVEREKLLRALQPLSQ